MLSLHLDRIAIKFAPIVTALFDIMISDDKLLFKITVLLWLIQLSTSANILVTVVSLSGSQNLLLYRLAESMAERGHNVTILKAEIFPEAKSAPLKHAKEVVYSVVPDPETLNDLRASMRSSVWSGSEKAPVSVGTVKKIFRLLRLACEDLLDHRKDLIQRLNDSFFDVMVIHLIDSCSFGLTRVLNIGTYVWMDSATIIDQMAWYSGTPLVHSYIPNTMAIPSHSNGRLSFLNRLKVFLTSIMMLSSFNYGVVNPYTDIFRQRYGHDFSHFDEILRKTQLYFINVHPIFEYPRPISPNVISIGGFTMSKVEHLNEDWKNILDKSPEDGVVLFSLGSAVNTSTMPQYIRMSFLNAFKRFPHLFIWRFEGEFPEAKSAKNILLSRWLPQKELIDFSHSLALSAFGIAVHPKVKAAIIHGGYNSLIETTYAGIPIIIFPLVSDQYGNAIRAIRHNIGVKLDKNNLSEQKVQDALNQVLYDHKIRDNAKRLGQMIREKPFTQLQQATEWLECLAKFKRLDQLRPKSGHLYLAQYLLLDVIAFLLFLIVSSAYAFVQ